MQPLVNFALFKTATYQELLECNHSRGLNLQKKPRGGMGGGGVRGRGTGTGRAFKAMEVPEDHLLATFL